jgi:ABC-type branched-subunit amino acid transport system substrate-binding protein
MRHQRRWLRLSALLMGFVIFAAACGGDDDDDGDTSATTEGESATAAPPIGEAEPSCTGDSDGTLTIGALLPETGDLSFLGPPAIAAAKLAVDDVNAAGGVLDKDVKYLPGDSGDADPDIANPTVDGHLQANADVILGAESSGVSLNVIDKIVGACKIQFSPANTSPQFTEYDDDDLYFRTAPSDVLQGQVLSELMLEDGVASAAILARQDAYGEGLLQYTKEPFEEGGGEVVVDRTYDPEAQTFEAEVDEVISEDPDALVMIGFDESSRILTSLFEQGFTPDKKKIYLVDGNIGNALGEDFTDPGALVGIKGTLPSAEVTQAFRDRLEQVDPSLTDLSYGPETYDAVVITALATVEADTDDPAKVANHINGITRDGTECTSFEECLPLVQDGEDIDYNGPSGPQDFSQPGEPTAASFAVMSYGEDNQIDEAATEYRTAQLG